MSIVDNLEKMLAQGQDTALLRYTLGGEYLKSGDPASAVVHLAEAVRQDPQYSAAWKSYGRALTETGRLHEAQEVYMQGIMTAESRGDLQAAKEMRVFLRRLQKTTQSP